MFVAEPRAERPRAKDQTNKNRRRSARRGAVGCVPRIEIVQANKILCTTAGYWRVLSAKNIQYFEKLSTHTRACGANETPIVLSIAEFQPFTVLTAGDHVEISHDQLAPTGDVVCVRWYRTPQLAKGIEPTARTTDCLGESHTGVNWFSHARCVSLLSFYSALAEACEANHN